MGKIISIKLITVLYTIVAWTVNIVKLVHLYQPEQTVNQHFLLHTVGIVPGVSWVTAWF